MAKGGHKSQMGAAEAPGPAAGYVFQLRYALFRALERLKRDPTGAIAIEKIDDVVLLDAGGAPTELDQLKHVTAQGASLTDASKPLWRTLGNWARLIVSGDLSQHAIEWQIRLVRRGNIMLGAIRFSHRVSKSFHVMRSAIDVYDALKMTCSK